jgi:hypothetical protein
MVSQSSAWPPVAASKCSTIAGVVMGRFNGVVRTIEQF